MGWDQAELGMAGESGQIFATIKGAVMAFSRSLAQSLSPRVRVNCLAPGWIRTEWAERASQYWQSRAVEESLLARWGTPEDVAAVAHFSRLAGGFVHHGPGDCRQWRPPLWMESLIVSDSTSAGKENPWAGRHIHFVTGRLAEFSLRSVLETIAPQIPFRYSVDVLGITVAALMTPAWIAPRIRVPPETDCVLIPGYCEGDLLRSAPGRASCRTRPS